MVPERLTNELLYQECRAEHEAKKRKLKENKTKKKTQGNSVKGLAKAYADLNGILESLQIQTLRGFHLQRETFMVHFLLIR